MKLNKEFFTGVTVGFGAGVLLGSLVDKEKRSVKGISKEFMRASILSMDKIKEGVVRAKENFEDLTAEVKSEIRNKSAGEDFDAKDDGFANRAH